MSRKRYRDVADKIAAAIREGRFEAGRLPPERDLAATFGVSRPTVREALLALEFAGVLEGRGVALAGPAVTEVQPEPDVDPFEVIEARRLFEGEAAALAAANITEGEIDALVGLLQIMTEHHDTDVGERADQDFHLGIARATHNTTIADAIENLWRLQTTGPRGLGLFAQARQKGFSQPVDDHQEILGALRNRDPVAARAAMHAHLDNLVRGVLEATEIEGVERVRREVASRRADWLRRVTIANNVPGAHERT